MSTKKIPTSVYAEMTPNPTTMKFVADRELVTGGHQLDFVTTEEAELCSPLAVELFHFPFVTGVFISGSIVSVTKDDSLGWEMIVSQLREYIREWLMDNEFAVEEGKVEGAIKVMGDLTPMPANPDSEVSDNFIHESDIEPSEHDDEIVRLLDEFVKPAVEQDGGAIHFQSFDTDSGQVTVILKGSCSGCPSSTATLKGGVENLLKTHIPEITEVVALNG